MISRAASPVVKDLVLVGGGHSHVAVLKRFGMRPLPGVRLTLITRDLEAPYSGMLPGLIAGHYGFDDAHIDLGPLARFAGARLYHDEVLGVDPDRRRVLCRDRPPVAYDLLSLNIGSAPNTEDVPGAAGNVIPVKPIDQFVTRWRALCDRVLAQPDDMRIGIVGAGVGGVELTLAVQYRLTKLLAEQGRPTERVHYHLLTDSPTILPTINRRARDKFERLLAARRITVHVGRKVERVEPGRLFCAGGFELALDEILWVTAAGAAPWLGASGLALDDHGFILVDDGLRSVSHPTIFAAGDIASMRHHERPKSGVFAVRQGRPLADNLRRALLGRPVRPFRPQRAFLNLIGTGDKYAVAARNGWALEGRLVWRWKESIDRRFVRRYNQLPEMAEARTPLPRGLADPAMLALLAETTMRCGGCGAKIGSDVLTRALARLPPTRRSDVLVGLGEPDDAAIIVPPPGKLLVQSVDYFRAFIDDPFLFGEIAANHCLGDLVAMGATPQSALAIATLPPGVEDKLEQQLVELLSGARLAFDAADMALVGGHTSEGSELALGFAVNGFIEPDRILRKSGLEPGDRLILTKPLGTGTLLAADMRHKAKGRWVDGALRTMRQSSQAAAQCLQAHGARACTDVTGFGLLGHLVEMVNPSRVDATLDLDAIPLLEGARETVALGIMSSLQPENLRLRRAIRDVAAAAESAVFPLLFDPQTAGGLLAGVPADRAEGCVVALRALGYDAAAIIGGVLPRSAGDTPIAVTA